MKDPYVRHRATAHNSYYKQLDDLSRSQAKKVKEEKGVLKCMICKSVFANNLNGTSDTGIARPQCPGCQEELELEETSND
jgi:hypothetical protein